MWRAEFGIALFLTLGFALCGAIGFEGAIILSMLNLQWNFDDSNSFAAGDETALRMVVWVLVILLVSLFLVGVRGMTAMREYSHECRNGAAEARRAGYPAKENILIGATLALVTAALSLSPRARAYLIGAAATSAIQIFTGIVQAKRNAMERERPVEDVPTIWDTSADHETGQR